MKFSIIIGNPPYQEMTGGTGGLGCASAKSIYQYFLDKSTRLSDIISMIVNNNWMYKSNVKINDIPLSIKLANFGITRIINYPVIEELFTGTRVTPCIVLLEKGKGDNPIYSNICNGNEMCKFKTIMNFRNIAVVTNKIELNILNKIDTTYYNMSKMTYGNTAFNISTDYIPYGINKEHKALIYVSNEAIESDIDRSEFTDNNSILNLYKVVCGRIINKNHIDDGIKNNVIVNIHVIEPGWVSSASFSVIGVSDSKDIAINIKKYYHTKFCRAMLAIGVPFSALCGKQRTANIPLQDFTYKSDIDWSKSIADIDTQLYNKYNLTKEEIDYIENTVN